ncbi:CDC5/polo family serine/threonine-protein kinase [Rhodotorula paludigena]|uniref:CDC5/polo family serine/threonine-protein kinase n=1 Tax=Rhodotorula paludigena TaxID=86838 RepID=UPI0031729154
MLVHPRHPDPLHPLAPAATASSSSSSRPPIPLSRSHSRTSTRQPRAPFASVQAHPPASSASRPGAMAAPAKPPAAPSANLAPPARQPLQENLQPAQPPLQGADKPTDKPKDRAKLTEQWGEPPRRIRRENVHLARGDLLGEGGFARVYLCTEPDGVSYKALKVIDKRQLKSTKTKAKLFAEIKIHQAMQHPNIIAFEHCFEDEGNVYMQLELCSNGSLLDLLRTRKRYSEPEARFYLTQLVGACDYMHSNSVIHRDLKLGNLMLDANMDLRVGDFGLAALVKFPGERKKTICGTPNYIAPEILFDTQSGHSFEVDIWSIGVILYTLLVGKPPFQTKDVKNIYRKIRDNAYAFPPSHTLSPESVSLISWILQPTPSSRPSLAQILAHDWFTTGPFPSRVSTRALDPLAAERMCDEWRWMTRREAREHFAGVKRRSGFVEPAPEAEGGEDAKALGRWEAVSQALPVVAEAPGAEEEEEDEGRKRRPTRMVRASEEKEAKGRVEKEVRQATAPESPISELLRSARKPLMVSPSSRGAISDAASRRTAVPSSSLQQRLAAASSSSATSAPASQSQPPPPQQPAFQRPRTTSSSTTATTTSARESATAASAPTAAPGSPRSRHRRAVAQVDAHAPAPATTAAAKTTTHGSRSLYDATWRSFDAFLACSAAADVAALASASATASADPEQERPRVFITSWVDYTHKYGTAYSLTDGTAGLYFNDSTTMVLSPDKEHFDYISNRQSNIYTRRHHTLSSVPEALERKAYLLRYFEDYMAKTLRRDVSWTFEDVERRKNMDFLVKYYRMKSAIVFKMSNDVLQFNFYDHHKLIISQGGHILTFIDPSFGLSTHSLPSLFRLAASLGHYSSRAPVDGSGKAQQLARVRVLLEKVEYCRDVLHTLANRKSSTAPAGDAKERR